MVRGAFDWLLPQILVWVERLAVWEVVLQVPMQLHAWRLQLHFEWIMYPEWAILKVLKCRTSIFLMWLVMWTITVKHFVPHPSLVFACNVLLLIIKIIFFKKISIPILFCTAGLLQCLSTFLKFLGVQVVEEVVQFFSSIDFESLSLIMRCPESVKYFWGMALIERETLLPSELPKFAGIACRRAS